MPFVVQHARLDQRTVRGERLFQVQLLRGLFRRLGGSTYVDIDDDDDDDVDTDALLDWTKSKLTNCCSLQSECSDQTGGKVERCNSSLASDAASIADTNGAAVVAA